MTARFQAKRTAESFFNARHTSPEFQTLTRKALEVANFQVEIFLSEECCFNLFIWVIRFTEVKGEAM